MDFPINQWSIFYFPLPSVTEKLLIHCKEEEEEKGEFSDGSGDGEYHARETYA